VEHLSDALILMGMLDGRGSHLLVAHMIGHLAIIYYAITESCSSSDSEWVASK